MPKPINIQDELQLIRRMSEGDMEAFDSLYWLYQHAVYQNIIHLTKDTVAAEDILQEVFISLWEKRQRVDLERSVGGWLFVSSYNRSVNFLKKRLREKMAADLISEAFTEPKADETINEIRLQELEKAIEKLPEQKQKVFYLCKIRGYTYEQTAALLNISKHTVKEHLSNAVHAIKDRLLKTPGLGFVVLFLENSF